MERSVERILTTHVGSLIRPPDLVDASSERHAAPPELDAARLRAAVADVVKRQVETGIDVVNDGEYGKSGWSLYFLDRVTGFEIREQDLRPLTWLGRDLERFPDFYAQEMPYVLRGQPTEACIGPIGYRGGPDLERDIDNLRSAAAGARPREVFMTTVAPASAAYNGVNEYYATERDYVFAIAEALREEYRAVHRAGFVLQVDDAVLANMYDALVRQSPHRYREWAELRVAALNHALEGIPPDRIRYHICFGSWHVPHVADAPLEAIVDLVLDVNAQGYCIEAANARHEHEWRVWEKVRLPKDKILIPGVVTHHTTTVEHPRLVADRIVRFAKLVGRENVIAGTDCGFAQSRKIQRVHPSVMWAKLEALVAGAELASTELF
ncbi:MAG TPA: cobalamin-independent methionine synthase II family protein [Gammaproteobacteria bacterium]|nr:cobalamin-independent methionine synthase II family protein [Gammaproteobacteria bacterium]